MVSLFSSFSKIKRQKILVIGDFVLDTYTVGKAKRISPEAPVPVLHVSQEEHRPGMSGNVALNLVSMGAEVVTIGRVGDDASGKLLIKCLKEEGIHTDGIVFHQGFPTPVKNRIIANGQQLVRIDHEEVVSLPEMLEQQVIEALPHLTEGVRLIAVSDYGKGFITRTMMSAIVEFGRKKHIPIIVDPKGVDFSKYSGADVVKPNLSEVYAAANLPPESSIEEAAARVLEITNAPVLMVTRSEAGISLFYKNGDREDFPVRIREVKDVTGAGDTVLAMLSCALANGLTMAEGAQLSNIAAGIAIERFGCARIALSELARRLLSDDSGNKVFDEQHMFALQEALKGRRFALLSLSSSEELSSQLFSKIRLLAQRENWDLLIHLQDLEPKVEFVELLGSLHDVDYIVKGEHLDSILERLFPEEVYSFANLDLKKIEPKEIVKFS